jgi:hypothetical protein
MQPVQHPGACLYLIYTAIAPERDQFIDQPVNITVQRVDGVVNIHTRRLITATLIEPETNVAPLNILLGRCVQRAR